MAGGFQDHLFALYGLPGGKRASGGPVSLISLIGVTTTTQGDLRRSIPVIGISSSQFVSNGTLLLSRRLLGSSVSVLGTAGSIAVARKLVGSSPSSFSSEGLLVVFKNFSGSISSSSLVSDFLLKNAFVLEGNIVTESDVEEISLYSLLGLRSNVQVQSSINTIYGLSLTQKIEGAIIAGAGAWGDLLVKPFTLDDPAKVLETKRRIYIVDARERDFVLKSKNRVFETPVKERIFLIKSKKRIEE
jgi:hypothetical protein